jgi:hypothetical protein
MYVGSAVSHFFPKNFNFLNYTQWQCILSYGNSTAMYKVLKTLHPGGFEPGNFCSVGGRNDHYATPPGQWLESSLQTFTKIL